MLLYVILLLQSPPQHRNMSIQTSNLEVDELYVHIQRSGREFQRDRFL